MALAQCLREKASNAIASYMAAYVNALSLRRFIVDEDSILNF